MQDTRLYQIKDDPNYDPARYAGRPLLAILDTFVLSCFKSVDPAIEPTMQMSVRAMWKTEKPWREAIIENIGLSSQIVESIKKMWNNNQIIAAQTGKALSPWDFAKGVSDHNFGPMFDDSTPDP